MDRAWPYIEADKVGNLPRSRTEFIFETGYGPSGLPHIGTFTEVLRTAMVMRAHQERYGHIKHRLIVFSDDLDGMRRAPENVPNQEMLKAHEGVSLSRVPDPFGCCESFAAHNNQQLRDFLDRFGFEYDFRSATNEYRTNPSFEGALRVFHLHHQLICDIITPTLGQNKKDDSILGRNRAATYSPFMPIDPETGHVYQVPILRHDLDGERIMYRNPRTGEETWTSILHGNCKLQWKADWAMRWFAQEVDYEMAGKDLTDSVALSSQILRDLGCKPPEGFIYEMFLDAQGRKVSKSVGNGMTIDDWLRYGTPDSLRYFLYREPTKAKKLHVGLVPTAVDQLLRSRREYHSQTMEQQKANPVHHIYVHKGDRNLPHRSPVPKVTPDITYSTLVNMVKLLGADRIDVIERYLESYGVEGAEELRELIPLVVNYVADGHAGEVNTQFHQPSEREAACLALFDRMLCLDFDASEESLQTMAYEVGKSCGYADNLRDWFKLIYQTVFGYPDGPRIGLFIRIYGVKEFVVLLRERVPAITQEA